MFASRFRCIRSRTCCPSVASTSATRPCGTGGTGSVRCLQPRSASAGFIIIGVRTGAGTLMRCWCGSTGRPAICGARSYKVFCHETAGSPGCTQVSETRDEALWPAGVDRHGRATVLPGCDDCDRQCGRPDLRSLAQQPGRELAPAVPTTGSGNGQFQGCKDPAEICFRPCLDPQPLQPRTPSQPPQKFSNRPGAPPWPSGVNWQPETV